MRIPITRELFLAWVVNCVERRGHCEVLLSHELDDEPLSPAQEAAHLFSHSLSRPGQSVPDVPKPKTLHGELRRICEERGWTWYFDPIRHEFLIRYVPEQCPMCKGSGRGVRAVRVDAPYDAFQSLEVVKCAICRGSGVKPRATKPQDESPRHA